MNQGLTADSIFVNGKVITVDSQFSIAQAVAVYGGKIVAVGTTEEVETLAGDGTQRVDLQGRTMLPGINDSHIHLSQSGLLLGKGLNRGQVMMREEPWTPEGLREAYRTAWDTCCKLGVTSVTDGDLGTKGNGERGGACGTLSLRILNDMHNAGELPVRVNVMLSFGPDHGDDQLEHLTDILPNLGWHSGFGDRKLRIAGLKTVCRRLHGHGNRLYLRGKSGRQQWEALL